MAQTTSESTATAFPAYPRWDEGIGDRLLDRMTYGRIRAWIEALALRGLRMKVDRKLGRTVLRLEGRLDSHSAPVLKQGFRAIIPFATNSIDVDLEGVSRVDGMGLAALVWAWRLTRERGGDLRLACPRPSVRELVARMNLHHLLQVVEDRESLLLPE